MKTLQAGLAEGRFPKAETLILLAACLFLLIATLPNLANFPVPSDDEIWILSASHKLATEGVFGSDLFTGFYRAEEVYLFNMPAHHLVLAAVFKLLGTSIFIARFVSVCYAIGTLILVYQVGKWLGGRTLATLAVGIVLLLRLNIGLDTGLPLQETARSIRYDLAPLPFMLGGMLLLLKPTLPRVALAGVVLSLAALMQFYGAFMLPIAAIYLAIASETLKQKALTVGILAAAALLTALPYGVYALSNYDEFKGQTSTLERRIGLGDPDFYIANFRKEDNRFPLHFGSVRQALTERPTAKLAILIGLPLAVASTGWRWYRERRAADLLLCLCLVGIPLQFALVDSQKLYFYWVAVLPFLALGLAQLCLPVLLRLREQAGRNAWNLALGGAAAAFLLIVLVEGTYAQVQGFRVMGHATEYTSLRDELDDFVPEGSRVVGATALWWAMPETEFRSYYLLFYFTNPRIAEEATTIPGYLDSFGAEYVVLNQTSRFFLGRLVQRDAAALESYLTGSGRQIAMMTDESYGWIEIWQIDRSKRPRGTREQVYVKPQPGPVTGGISASQSYAPGFDW